MSMRALAVAEDGVAAVLRHLGVLPDEAEDAGRRTRAVQVPDRGHFLMCPGTGLFAPAVGFGGIGSRERCDVAGWLHDLDDPARAPEAVRFGAAGEVVARRLPALARRGDYLFTTAVEAVL